VLRLSLLESLSARAVMSSLSMSESFFGPSSGFRSFSSARLVTLGSRLFGLWLDFIVSWASTADSFAAQKVADIAAQVARVRAGSARR
jgi:hypothetical protein